MNGADSAISECLDVPQAQQLLVRSYEGQVEDLSRRCEKTVSRIRVKLQLLPC